VRLDDVIKQEHIIKILSRQKELNFEPGEEYLYCDSGYTLLAEIVSKVSGMDFCEFTNENIFQPLGMKQFKTISDFLTDCKVPSAKKKEQLVLTYRNHIVWVVGLRMDERYKVNSKSKKVLKLWMK